MNVRLLYFSARNYFFYNAIHGTQKFHPVVKYKHYQISSRARTSLIFITAKFINFTNQLTIIAVRTYDQVIVRSATSSTLLH